MEPGDRNGYESEYTGQLSGSAWNTTDAYNVPGLERVGECLDEVVNTAARASGATDPTGPERKPAQPWGLGYFDILPGYRGGGNQRPATLEELDNGHQYNLDRLRKAIEQSDYFDEAFVLKQLQDKKWKLWNWPEVDVVTDTYDHPKMRVLRVLLVSGSGTLRLKRERALIEYADIMGCKRILGEGRIELKATLLRMGYKQEAISFYKEI